MRLRSVGLLFCMLALAGCHRKAVVIVPPPLPPVGPAVVSVPPPTHPPEPAPEVVEVPPVPTPPPTPPKRPVHRRPAPAPPATTATAPAAAPPVELGQLSTGGEANNAALRQGAEDLLRAQQKRLLALPPAVTAAHREQTERASLFLRDADDAWKKLDIEGTRTLATKAKVLLDEITQ
jgi:outer membrane biosynthesis protein TonB